MQYRLMVKVALVFLTLFVGAMAYAFSEIVTNEEPNLTLEVSWAADGKSERHTLEGSGFPGDTPVLLFEDDRYLQTVTSDSAGDFSSQPIRQTPGAHKYLATDAASAYAVTSTQIADERPPNRQGIAVSEPKVFDERDLRVRFDGIAATLAAAQYVDPSIAISAIGKPRAGMSSSSWFQASLVGPPALQSQSTSSDVVNSTAGSTSATSTHTTGLTTTSPSITPTGTTTMPSLGNNPFSTQTSIGLGPFDVLAQQTELAFEAYNISMLLSGALSDKIEFSRVKDADRYRSQAVIGFQVGIDPPPNARDLVAEVVITIRSNDGLEPPSLRELLPRAKTYNVSTIRQGSRALGLGLVARLISLNVSGGRSNQNVYFVQDVDTVAVAHLSPEEEQGQARGSLRFGWQFRPVLDQRTVSPGLRQVFAVLSLPTREKEDWMGTVNVQTFWRSYDRKTRTAGRVREGLLTHQQKYPLYVPSIEDQHKAVSAKIDALNWSAVPGTDRAIVTVEGHIPRGALVAVGDTKIDSAANGMILSTSQRMTFAVPLTKLASDDAEVIDAYGVSTKLVERPKCDPAKCRECRKGDPFGKRQGFAVTKVTATPNGADTVLGIYLKPKGDACLFDDLLDHRTPPLLVRTGGSLYGLLASDLKREVNDDDDATLRKLSLRVPTQAFTTEPAIFVYVPFYGDDYRHQGSPSQFSTSIFTATAARVLAITGKTEADRVVRIGITGTHLDGLQLNVMGQLQRATNESSETLAIFSVKLADLAGTKQLELKRNGQLALLALPDDLQPTPFVLSSTPDVTKGVAEKIRLQGVNFSALARIEFKGQSLEFIRDPIDPSRIDLSSDKLMGSEPGTIDIQLIGVSGSSSTWRLTVVKK